MKKPKSIEEALSKGFRAADETAVDWFVISDDLRIIGGEFVFRKKPHVGRKLLVPFTAKVQCGRPNFEKKR